MKNQTFEELMREFDEILKGIDECETESKDGWWEVSDSADFGKNKKMELLSFIKKVYEAGFSKGWKVGYVYKIDLSK